MSFTPEFAVSTTSNPAQIVITDLSLGSDPLIIDRTIQLLTTGNTLLVPQIDFPLSAGSSITINPLFGDIALNILVTWNYTGGVVQYQNSQVFAFTEYGERFLYYVTQTITAFPEIVLNPDVSRINYLIDSAEQAIEINNDLAGSEACILQYQAIISRLTTVYSSLAVPQPPVPPQPPSPPAPPPAGITALVGDVMAGPGSGSQTATLAPSGVTAGSYTFSNITVNAKGLVTGASNGTPPVSGITQLTGDVLAGPGNGPQIATLPASGAVAGTYTDPVVTVNAKGIVTSIASGGGLIATSMPTTTALGILTNGTDQTSALNTVFLNANYEGIIMDFFGGGAVTINGTLNCQGKTIKFFPGSYFTGTGTIINFFLDAGAKQKGFDITLNVQPYGTMQGWISPWIFGAKDDGSDCAPAIQKTIDTVIAIGSSSKLEEIYLTSGFYTLNSPLIFARWTGSVYAFFQVTFRGDCLFSEASGYGTQLTFNFHDRFGIGIQAAKSTKIVGLKLNGKFGFTNFPAGGAYAFFSMGLAAMTDGVSRDQPYSPNAAIVIDPFGFSVPSDGGYPGNDAYGNALSTYYRGGGTSGSTGVYMEDIFVNQWVIGFITSPNGHTQNAELCKWDRIQISNCKIGFAGCQSQEKMNVIKHVQAWGLTYYLFAAGLYGAGSQGNWVVENFNIAGALVGIVYDSTTGYYPSYFKDGFAESLGKIGFVNTPLGITFENIAIDFAYYNNGGAFQYLSGQINCSGCTFIGCMLRINGTSLPVTINTDFGPSVYRSCSFETPPFYIPTNNGFGGNPIFDNCYCGGFIFGRRGLSTYGFFENSFSYGTYIQNGFQINSDFPARPLPINQTNATYAISPALVGSYYAVTLTAVADEITSGRVQVGDTICASPDASFSVNMQVLGLVTAVGASTFTITYISTWVTSGNSYYLYIWLPLWNIAFKADTTNGSNVLHNVTGIAGNLTTFTTNGVPRGALLNTQSFSVADTQQSKLVRVVGYSSGAGTMTLDKNVSSSSMTAVMISQADCQPIPGTPTVVVGTGAGTGGSPTATITRGNDQDFHLKIVTGTGPAASATVATITLSVGFAGGYIPSPVLSPTSSTARQLSGTSAVSIDATRPDTLVLSVDSTNLAATTTYEWNISNK